jgi:hypothetical protein
MATLIYDSKITNKDEILKRIALVGYDSENSMRKRLLTARFLVVASMTEQLMRSKRKYCFKSQAAQTQQTKKKNN